MQYIEIEALSTFTIREKFDGKRVNQYVKDRIESFDDYYPCMQQKGECNLFHVHNWIQFFVSMYNNTISNKNDFIIQLQEEEVVNLS
ncbi:MAG TPA: hypothetical protein VHJ38_01740 [Nitrososphaeraceae archaeon]|jgi:hypothetical protein|nr:hypothetical protein [Nitrososphaeraceae archaeon]